MVAAKVDFDVALTPACKEGSVAVKGGDAVRLAWRGSDLLVLLAASNEELGIVPPSVVPQLPVADRGSVRSVRKQRATLLTLTVRVNAQEQPFLPKHVEAPVGVEETENEASRVRQKQLEKLVGSKRLHTVLASERLQEKIAAVDSANNREAALEEALQDQDFQAFTETLLDIIA